MDAKETPGNETEAHVHGLFLAWQFFGIRTLGTGRVVLGYPWGGRRPECR